MHCNVHTHTYTYNAYGQAQRPASKTRAVARWKIINGTTV